MNTYLPHSSLIMNLNIKDITEIHQFLLYTFVKLLLNFSPLLFLVNVWRKDKQTVLD